MKIAILFYIFGTAAAMTWRTTRIVGGSDTTVERYPFMSNMQYGFLGIWWYQSCGGSLITRTSVLSAAHCYYGDDPSSWRVVLGTSFQSSGGITHSVSKLIVHQNYDSNLLINDVAIVKLQTPATLSCTIALAKLPPSDYRLLDDTVVTAIGWGALSSGGSSPQQLQHVNVNVINQEICAERYAELKTESGYEGWPNITAGMLCLGVLDVGGKDTCQGDSGGPVAHRRNIIVGITSWGKGCAEGRYPGVNTRVTYHSKWIETFAN